MKYPALSGAFLFAALLVALPPASGRVGESRRSLEGRLLDTGGIVYRDDAVEELRKRGMPYLPYLELFETKPEVRVYFKTADGRRPSSSELEEGSTPPGWDLHVVYLRGRSAIEVYRRSTAITEYELNELLARQTGGSFWKKVPRAAQEESVFGYEMELENGSLRARRVSSDTLMVFDAGLDKRLAAVREEERREDAPGSVRGF